jgi:Cytochrome C'
MRIDFSRGMPDRKRANVKSRPARKALAFVVLGPSLLMVTGLLIFALFGRSAAYGQAQGATSQVNNAGSGNPQPVGTMSDVMTSMVYPAANNILLAAYRGGAQDDKEWLAIQRSAVLLAESGNVLMMRGPAGDQSDWAKDAKMLSEAGAAAYKAARAKDANALMAVAQPLNAACTACHKQYRANIAGPAERVGPSHQPAE